MTVPADLHLVQAFHTPPEYDLVNGTSVELWAAASTNSELRDDLHVLVFCMLAVIAFFASLACFFYSAIVEAKQQRDLDAAGTVVTLDALHTQRATAEAIVAEHHTAHVFSVKAHQPNLAHHHGPVHRHQRAIPRCGPIPSPEHPRTRPDRTTRDPHP
ncbi:MAG: hypothetical protein ACRDVE_02350 [Actinocrinis sp.]